MTKLEQLIEEHCPDGVEIHPLEKCCIILDNKRKPITKAARKPGEYPYYGANGIQDYVDDYIFDGIFILVGEDGSVITPSGNPVVNWAEGRIWVNNHAHIVSEKDGVLLRYLFHFLQTIDVSSLIHGNIPKLTGKDFKALKIPVPPLEVQAEINRILDKYTELSKELTSNLTTEQNARKKQYEYYLNDVFSKINASYEPMEEYYPFIRNGFVGTVTKHFTDKEHGVRYIEGKNIHDGEISDNDEVFVTKDFHEKHIRNELKADDILMVQSGHVGECAVVGEKYAGANCHALIIMSNGGNIDSRFVVYYFQTEEGKKKLKRITTGGTVKHILASTIKKVTIPVPPIEEQKRIVAILDRFDKLCNDISEGLPAEIEARQKQYEYYRDLLLSFNKKRRE